MKVSELIDRLILMGKPNAEAIVMYDMCNATDQVKSVRLPNDNDQHYIGVDGDVVLLDTEEH